VNDTLLGVGFLFLVSLLLAARLFDRQLREATKMGIKQVAHWSEWPSPSPPEMSRHNSVTPNGKKDAE
jgi:hypothetical protein